MRRFYSLILVLALVLIIVILAFWLGRKTAKPVYESIVSNTTFVRQIAELASLEVQGNASLKHTNLQNDGSFTDAMRRVFLENTVNLAVPYIAKYGVDLQTQDIRQSQQDSTVTVYLPEPQLLSYELRMDRADAMSKKGWLESESSGQYLALQKKLYTDTRHQMEINNTYIEASKVKITKIISDYYAPMHLKVKVVFGKNDDVSNVKPEG